jgi:signal transduction histidine kinase
MTQVKLGQYQDAIVSAKRAIKLSEPSHFFQEMNYGYYVLTEAYSGLGDYKSALAMNQQMAAIQDSMYNAASAEKLVELETSKKEQQIQLLQSQKAQENIIRNALIAGALALAVFVVVLVRGNNRRKRDNARLAELNDKLFDANEELSLLTSEKDEILNIVSHGLKSQIFGVRSLADSMTTALALGVAPINTAPLSEMSRTISQASTQMFSLVTNLLTVNTAEQGLLKPTLSKTNVGVVLNTVCEEFKEFAAVKNITLSIEAPESEESNAIADEQMLREVLENLLSNAVKYSPQGKNIHIRIRHSSLAIGHLSDENSPQLSTQVTNAPITNVPITNAPMTNDYVRMEVQDEGPGISPDDMKKLFGKFARLSAQPTGGEHSTGLGLSIVKKMVEAMNGHVWCESELGKGATFIVELPTAP